MTGFPQDFLTAHYQIPNGASYKKYTHWAMSCVHPFETTSKKQFASSSVINTMDTALVTTFWGTKVFLTFTKDILRYYKSATHRFQYAPGSIDGATRRLVLDDLHAKLKQQPFSTK
jgi:hypothetical protein